MNRNDSLEGGKRFMCFNFEYMQKWDERLPKSFAEALK
jgi:hypothetical protein